MTVQQRASKAVKPLRPAPPSAIAKPRPPKSRTSSVGEKQMDSTKVEIPTCVVVNGGPGRPGLAVMGDSVAKSMHPAFAMLAQRHGWTFVAAAHNRCTVVVRRLAWGAGWESCMAAIPVIQREVLSHHPSVIVISDNWLPIESYDDAGVMRQRNSPEHIADIERRMNELIPALTSDGALVVLMRFTPEAAALECADPGFVDAARCKSPGLSPRFSNYNDMLDRVVRRFADRARSIDLTDVVCPRNQCAPKVDGVILRYDMLHYSDDGSRWLAPHIERKLTEAGIKLDL